MWIANRRMQLEREHACDDYVLRHGTAPSLYAEELLTAAAEVESDADRLRVLQAAASMKP